MDVWILKIVLGTYVAHFSDLILLLSPGNMDISVQPDHHDGPFPNFRQPMILGHFSLNGDREFIRDMSGLQYLHVRRDSKVELDLDHNLHLAKKPLPKKETEKINNLLRGVLSYKNKFTLGDKLDNLHTDVVCFRLVYFENEYFWQRTSFTEAF